MCFKGMLFAVRYANLPNRSGKPYPHPWAPSWPLSLRGGCGKEGVAEMVAPVFFYIKGNGVGKMLVQQGKRVGWRIHAVHPVAFHSDEILAITGKVVHHFAAFGGQRFQD